MDHCSDHNLVYITKQVSVYTSLQLCYHGNDRWLLGSIPYWGTVSNFSHQVIMDHVILCVYHVILTC